MKNTQKKKLPQEDTLSLVGSAFKSVGGTRILRMFYHLSQFTIWLVSQTYLPGPVILFTVQFSPQINDVDMLLYIRSLWEWCDQEWWNSGVKKFWFS